MTQPTDPQDAKFRSQFAAARIAALEYGDRNGRPIQLETAGVTTRARSLPEFVYEKDCVLINDEHADTILKRHLDADRQPENMPALGFAGLRNDGVPGAGDHTCGLVVSVAVLELDIGGPGGRAKVRQRFARIRHSQGTSMQPAQGLPYLLREHGVSR